MQVSIETTSKLERRLTVGVPAERVDVEVDNRLLQAARKVRLPGFRPGKVPLKVMRQRFGADVRQEVLGEVMSQSLQEAIQREKLRPAGRPSIEPRNLDPGKDLEYVATFEVFPEIELADLTGLSVERLSATVSDADVDEIIGVFCRQQGSWQAVDRAATEGDRVTIDYSGTRGGEPFEGGSAEGSQLELGSGRMIPGFEDGVVGMQAGEEKTLQLVFPTDYHNEDLRGAAVEFEVRLVAVEELVPAPVDEALFAKYGVEEGGEAQFRREVAENMTRELKNAIEGKVKQQVMDALLDAHQALEVPRAMVQQEISTLRRQMFQQFGGAGADDGNLDLESLLPDEMFRDNAERRVKLGLLMAELIARENLQADPEKVRAHVEELASTYENPQEVIEYYYANDQQLAAVESKVLEDMVVEKLLENAEVKLRESTYRDAINQDSTAA